MPDEDRIVAIGLLTERDVFAFGNRLTRIYPIDEVPCFGTLLADIDDADRELRRTRDAATRLELVGRDATSPR